MRGELRGLTRLALPVVGAQAGGMLMGVVDTMMVGRVSVDALAAAAMANAWIYGALLFGQGLVQGIDPLVAQAHGAGRGRDAGLALQRGLVLAVAIGFPLAGSWFWTEEALLLFGQEPQLAELAHEYTVIQIPSVFFFLGFVALRHYLQGREIVRPAMWVTLLGNVFNFLANYALIFGHFGAPALGLWGAGIATALTRVFMFAGLWAVVLGFGLHRDAWLPWSRAAFSVRAMRSVLHVGLPVGIQVAFEVWAFSASTLLAGRLGAIPLASHNIALNMAALTFMVTLGISHAAVTRVGNFIGAGNPQAAERAAWVAISLGAAVMSVFAAGFLLLREWLPLLYTADPAVVALCASVLPIAGALQIFDGIQVVGAGILRGMGRTRPAAWFNLIGHWVIGLPVGGWLALRAGWGIEGLWWGLCLGLSVVAISMLVWLRVRGPAPQPHALL